MEIECGAKAIIVNYQCDICHNGNLICIDSNNFTNDEGQTETTYTHRCTACGVLFEIDNIKYPYYKIIPDIDK